LRLLLAGAEPAELLAITFTRKAAQEMQSRLLSLLRELALLPEQEVCSLLRERGVEEENFPQLLPRARALYARVLASPQGLSVNTFHSWFNRLIKLAPLAAGVPHGYALSEQTGELLSEAYGRFMQGLNDAENDAARAALQALYVQVGDSTSFKLLKAFIEKRAEWWVARTQGEPMAWLEDLCGEDGERDARLTLWQDAALCERLIDIARLLGQGTATNQKRATLIESAITDGPNLASFAQLCAQFFDDKGKPRSNDHRRGKFLKVIEAHFGEHAIASFEQAIHAAAASLQQLNRRGSEPAVLALNRSLFLAGSAYLDCYQQIKAERRVFDFADLEWHVWRLLTDEAHAAYLHSRLDARYKHILLDEFQDTNPLQWGIVRAWLDAYGADTQRPSVFIVGDPKQSIYRFRRADQRVFTAAVDLLRRQGAHILKARQTRRNAHTIVAALNVGMTANPIYAAQTTASEQEGAVWRLPLIAVDTDSKGEKSKDAQAFFLRDPLTTPLPEDEDARRLDEAHQAARALLQARQQLQIENGEVLPWRECMLLVKKRTHLRAYEIALREAGIPFVSDRRGGLLNALEILDLLALLGFLTTPTDDRALAHVLKSPLFSASDDELIALAQRREPDWWQRLQAGAADSPALTRAVTLLAHWLEQAPHLPVHDLLDRVLHQGQVMPRYAEAAPPLLREQVRGNIDAFVALALNLDAGRYPSLPKFIDALHNLQQGEQSDAPNEADIDVATDAVRILTVHSAKGLEADVVLLLDANHSEPPNDNLGILCNWPQDAAAPEHFSAFERKSERGAARDALFAEEETFRQQEDWNLLYVAATRARRLLIVSGVADGRKVDAGGIADASWYHRLLHVPAFEPDANNALDADPQAGAFTLRLYAPTTMPAALPSREPHSDAIAEGIALHALLERIVPAAGRANAWPPTLPPEDVIADWLPCTRKTARAVHMQAQNILQSPELERYFNPAHYREAHNEMEIATDEGYARLDRLVVFDEEIWILDYKRTLQETSHDAHRAQLGRYRTLVQTLFPGKAIRSALIAADGGMVERN
ncbi:MAG: UvrD-helicase domain-containing protein, partial [Proteobacteria bacterium]|nr:UvrD-helicase domain-containing protein [Pseudomonadota bacterium]